jgi:hypothetical protein
MITVKVKYFQLQRAVEVKEEAFALDPGSRHSDLLGAVLKKHPSLTYVTMLALIDGVPPAPDAELGNGGEVDFLASPMGG